MLYKVTHCIMGHCIFLQRQRPRELGRKQKVALKCDVSVEKREAENLRGKRSGTTIFAFYISSVINSKLYIVLMGFFQREFSKKNRVRNLKT